MSKPVMLWLDYSTCWSLHPSDKAEMMMKFNVEKQFTVPLNILLLDALLHVHFSSLMSHLALMFGQVCRISHGFLVQNRLNFFLFGFICQ